MDGLEEERLELLLLGTTPRLEGEALGSTKNTDPVLGSAVSAHKSSSMLYKRPLGHNKTSTAISVQTYRSVPISVLLFTLLSESSMKETTTTSL